MLRTAARRSALASRACCWVCCRRAASSSAPTSSSPPLIQLSSFPLSSASPAASASSAPPTQLTWSLDSSACWAVVAPSSAAGATAVKQRLINAIAGRGLRSSDSHTVQRAPALRQPGAVRLLTLTNRGPAQAAGAGGPADADSGGVGGGGGAGAGAAFVDYSARYGAIRDTDRTTLFESILATHDVQTGSIARRAFMPDPLLPPGEAAASSTHLLKQRADPRDVAKAHRLRDRIHRLGPYLNVTEELLQRPLIAMSNGQLTRAKILSALLPARDPASEQEGSMSSESKLELLVLDLPYSGLDPPSRQRLSDLLSKVHGEAAPRILLGLREGDPIPAGLVSHVLWIRQRSQSGDSEPGSSDVVEIRALTRDQYEEELRRDAAQLQGSSTARAEVLPPPFFLEPSSRGSLADLAKLPPSPQGSLQQVIANAQAGVGIGRDGADAYIEMRNVSIQYKGFHALKNVDLALRPGSRLILAGPNGSGKTTLLSLLLGDHPLSFSFPALHEADSKFTGSNGAETSSSTPSSSPALSLFGRARSHRTNASPLLARRIGHTSPELFRAFPRQTDLERGGLSLGQAIGSGFEGVFVRRPLEVGSEREARVRGLVRAFADLFRGHGRRFGFDAERPKADANHEHGTAGGGGGGGAISEDALTALIHETPFAALSPGSQSLALLLRACVHDPALLILDEPFAGMDAAQVERARVFVDRALWAGAGAGAGAGGAHAEKAMVLISHYEQEWPATFGQLLRLDEGTVVERI